MTAPAALLAAVTIAFPKEGAQLPALANCYAIGATDGCETNLGLRLSASRIPLSVPVSPTGAWGVLMDVVPGTNVMEIGGTRRSFVIAPEGAAEVRKTYSKLEYAADAPKPHPAGRPPSEITVVVDAGHGGPDTGAVSPHGRFEKDANLLMARAVRSALTNRGYRVVMTREDDSLPALYDRPKVAHREHADAFVSIHYNAPGYDKDPTRLRYQAVYAWNAPGERLARAINARMSAAATDLANEGVLHANFAVTRNPEIPSCLIETDFITSPEGEAAAWDPVRIAATASAVAAGVSDWVTGAAGTGAER